MTIDAQKYDKIARTVFAPVFPLIADQIIAYTGLTQGTCLDIGGGGGYLGAALAEKTDLSVRLFDASPDMLEVAKRTIVEKKLTERADTLQGDVTAIPLPDNTIDLAVSRGSIFFWDDLPRALTDIHRVITPDGWAYIGGGFGSKAITETIVSEMKKRNQGSDEFRDRVRRNLGPESRERFETAIKTAGLDRASILHDEEIGLWIIIRK